jgi:hypothetical protein
MGQNYSFEVGFRAEDTAQVISTLVSMLTPEQQSRLQQLLPWQAAIQVRGRLLDQPNSAPFSVNIGIQGYELDSRIEPTHDSYCLCLYIPLNKRQKHEIGDFFIRDHLVRDHLDKEYLVLGCLWSTLVVGQDYGLLRMTAATSNLSYLLIHEPIYEWFRQHLSPPSLFVLLDTEAVKNSILSPIETEIQQIAEEDYTIMPPKPYSWTISPDHYVPAVLEQITAPSPNHPNCDLRPS